MSPSASLLKSPEATPAGRPTCICGLSFVLQTPYGAVGIAVAVAVRVKVGVGETVGVGTVALGVALDAGVEVPGVGVAVLVGVATEPELLRKNPIEQGWLSASTP